MTVDRAPNTLGRASRLTNLGTGTAVRDFVGRSDRDDLYRIQLSGRSRFSLQLSNVKLGTSLRAEVFSPKRPLGSIANITFSRLTRQQIDSNLTRLGSSTTTTRSTTTTIRQTLNRGVYFLRISPSVGESSYRLAVRATPVTTATPTPTPTPTPAPPPVAVTFNRSWLQQFGTGGNDYAYGTAIDRNGNVYVSGTTPNAIDGSTTDAFVAKYNSSGQREWLRSFGSVQNSDTAFDVAVDAQGNYYVAGVTNLNTSNVFTADSDGFVAKFSADGRQLWWQEITSTVPFLLGSRNGLDAVSSLAIDRNGNAYVSGFTKALPTIADESKAFVAKFNGGTGAREWLTEFGGTGADAATDIGLDAAGNVYITGVRDADLTTNANNPFVGGRAFVAKFNNSGARQWDQSLASSGDRDYARSIAVTANGTIYITGQTDGALPGQTSAGGRDAFLARYNTDGTRAWVQQFGTASLDEGQAIAIAPDGSIYVTGETNASLFSQPHAGDSDAFFAQFAPNGTRLNTQQIGTSSDDETYNLGFDSAGNLFLVGQTIGAFPNQTNLGSYDFWVAKYTPQTS